jgi:3,4-dihydroxy 2-butanone 4-phosphate synthase
MSLLSNYGNSEIRLQRALSSLRQGNGILLLDDEDRENEGDLIFPAETITPQQMALLIRECSGIVCLCLTHEHIEKLQLHPMTESNTCTNQTAFTVSIEARHGVTTGVSAADRSTTILTAIKETCKPEDLARPGHVFPLRACPGGVLERRGHTEGTVDLMKMAGLKPAGVLCEVTNPDGTMARLKEIISFGKKHDIPVITIDDIYQHRLKLSKETDQRKENISA